MNDAIKKDHEVRATLRYLADTLLKLAEREDVYGITVKYTQARPLQPVFDCVFDSGAAARALRQNGPQTLNIEINDHSFNGREIPLE